MHAKDLEKLGFTSAEAKVYLAALELGETSVARISSKARIERTTTYGIIDALKAKGLLTIGRRGKRMVYIAEDPRKLKLLAEERSRLVDQMLPSLLSITNAIDRKPTIRYFEDAAGINDIYRDTLNFVEQPILIWMSDRGVWYDDESFWKDFYIPARLERKIALRVIAPDTQASRDLQGGDRASLRSTKLDRERAEKIESEIMLYGGRNVAIISCDEMMGVVVESQKLYRTLKGIFEVHWQTLP